MTNKHARHTSGKPFIAYAGIDVITIGNGQDGNAYDVPVELVADAPALLEALEDAEDALTHTGPCQCCPGSSETGHEHGCLVLRIRVAIAQAKGETA